MQYPKFLEKNDTIGITAPSAGVGRKLEEYEEAYEVLTTRGYRIVEGENLKVNARASGPADVRGKDLTRMMLDDSVDAVFCATGGDYMIETLPYIDFEKIAKKPKLFMGMSDPTNFIYPLTSKYDIATVYGNNAVSFRGGNDKELQYNFDIVEGRDIIQESFDYYLRYEDEDNGITIPYRKVEWKSKGEVEIKGRLIGGCLDAIQYLIGTKYDGSLEFIEKYKDDGIVWFFDIYGLSAFQTYEVLMQFKLRGMFEYCKGVLIGRIAFPSNVDNDDMTYDLAFEKALGDIPYISEMDIGHVSPSMVLINGAIINVKCKEEAHTISFELK